MRLADGQPFLFEKIVRLSDYNGVPPEIWFLQRSDTKGDTEAVRMMERKACPRCKQGDLYMDADDCMHCMQCGYLRYRSENPFTLFKLSQFLGGDGAEREPAAATR